MAKPEDPRKVFLAEMLKRGRWPGWLVGGGISESFESPGISPLYSVLSLVQLFSGSLKTITEKDQKKKKKGSPCPSPFFSLPFF